MRHPLYLLLALGACIFLFRANSLGWRPGRPTQVRVPSRSSYTSTGSSASGGWFTTGGSSYRSSGGGGSFSHK